MNDIQSLLANLTTITPKDGDFIGEGGLLYCGRCRTPKQQRVDKPGWERMLFPCRCQCAQQRHDNEQAAIAHQKHQDTVETLKCRCFADAVMREWTFANDNGQCPQMDKARFYVKHWERMQTDNIGYLPWGGVGTGKSYLAGCIANALLEQEIPVHMTNFAHILNALNGSFAGCNEYIAKLCGCALLIIDDFGMERSTGYSLEQIYNVIDSRYRSHKPLIVSTNLTLDSLQHPEDTAYARIYDRLLEMCVPIRFTGESFRKTTAQDKLNQLKSLMDREDSANDK